jgi:hypothetical protein
MRTVTMVMFAILTSLGSRAGEACGDKLVAMGGGVRLERVLASAHPGSVIVMADAAPGTGPGGGGMQLVAALKQAGHDVRLVDGPDAFERALRDRAPDIVLADPRDVDQLRSQARGSGPSPVIVPMLYRPSRAELEQARRVNTCVAPLADWGVAPVLRVVDGIRAQQTAGRSVDCAVPSRSRT